MLSWRNSSPTRRRPFAWSVAILAHVPVPHGERSSTPVQVDGFDQSSVLVETVVAFRHELRGSCAGPESWPMVIPVKPGCSGWTTGSCSAAAALIISVTRVMSRPSSGTSRNPSASASAMTWNMPPYATSTTTVPSCGTSIGRVQVRGEGRDVAERDAR